MIGFVLASMTKNLSDRAAGAQHRAAEIFTALALLLGNLVLSADTSTGLHEGPNGPDGESQRSNEARDRDVARRVGPVWSPGNLQSDRIHRVRDDDGHHDLEGVASRNLGSRNSEPREVHPFHGLAHGNLSAPQRAAEMRMEDAITEAVEQTIFPLARGSSEARSVGQLRGEGRKECVALLHATSGLLICESADGETVRRAKNEGCKITRNPQRMTCRQRPVDVKAKRNNSNSFIEQRSERGTHHFNCKGTLRIIPNLGLKGVSLWERGRRHDVNHHWRGTGDGAIVRGGILGCAHCCCCLSGAPLVLTAFRSVRQLRQRVLVVNNR